MFITVCLLVGGDVGDVYHSLFVVCYRAPGVVVVFRRKNLVFFWFLGESGRDDCLKLSLQGYQV